MVGTTGRATPSSPTPRTRWLGNRLLGANDGLETDLGVRAIAERLVRRAPASTERDALALHFELMSFYVYQANRSSHHVGSIVERGDRRLVHEPFPPGSSIQDRKRM